jgi:lysozyme family protein
MDYIDLYNRLVIDPSVAQQVFKIATEIRKEKRYFEVERDTGVSASLVGAIHQLESGRNFNTHLHNGDSLSRKTRRSPAGRPPGKAPFTWLESAIDAVDYDELTLSSSKAEQCKSAVRYNGLGYEKHGVVSPYGFTGSQFYKRGKYVSDGRYSPNTVSTQIGVCVILKEIERLDKLDIAPMPVKPTLPVTERTVVVSGRVGDDIVPIGSPRGIIGEAPLKTNPPFIPVQTPVTDSVRFIQPKPSTKISKYLTVGQFTKNGTRKFVSQKHFQACKDLAIALDRVQEFYGKRLIITSGIRTPSQNRSAGGVDGSYHLTISEKCAADFRINGVSGYELFDDFDNVWVGGLGRYSTGIVHMDLGLNRRWDWSGRAGLPTTDSESFAYGESEHGEEHASVFPAHSNASNKDFILKTKRGTIVIKPNVNMYVGDVILSSTVYS